MKMNKILITSLMLLFTALLWFGCSEYKNPLPSNSHPESWNQPGNDNFHGKKVLTVGYSSCFGCHGKDLNGGESKISCFKCHTSYPHADGWMTKTDPAFHGVFLKNMNWTLTNCQDCHGLDNKGGTSQVSCFKCHGSYPHAEGWLNKLSDNYHGAFLKANAQNILACQQCHGTDFKGGTSEISCYTCHATYPHTADWSTPTSENYHGKLLATLDWDAQSCQACHGADYKGGSSEQSCFTCHTSYPHADGWANKNNADYHGVYLKGDDQRKLECQNCHGTDYNGGTSGISCNECHATYPHTSGWNTESSQDFHGKFLASANWSAESCQSCHGNDLKGGTSNISCFTCHTTYPHTEGWIAENNANFHGLLIKNANWSTTDCQACHGTDLTGGTSNQSCFSCHENYPHNSNWLTQGSPNSHAAFVRNLGYETDGCQACHGTDLKGGFSEKSCYKCHETYPHNESWVNGTDSHGPYLKHADYDLSSCQSCHGADNTGGTSEVSCYRCHKSYPHNEQWNIPSSSDYHGKYLNNLDYNLTTCQYCHGADNTGGTSEISCYTCHQTFPHNENWVNGTDSHGPYLKHADYDLSSCQSCHGADNTGGTSEVSCYRCHKSYPHNDQWIVPSSSDYHGVYLNNLDYNLTTCQYCHGADNTGGTSEISCYTCHQTYPHNTNWTNEASADFHGLALKEANWEKNNCASCHGSDYKGGTSGTSCYTCHNSYPHVSGFYTNDESQDFHGKVIKNNGWSLASCQTCHGVDYKGGVTEKACTKCHVTQGGPEACNLCHGSNINLAPPNDLDGNKATTFIGVGAHQLHLAELEGDCNYCHYPVAAFDDETHIDGTQYSEIKPVWKWNRDTATCTSICHNDANKTYIWNNF